MAAFRVSVGLVPLVSAISRLGFVALFVGLCTAFAGWLLPDDECGGALLGMSRGGRFYRYSGVVIPGDTFCSRVRHAVFLEGQAASSRVTVSNNRSVMPLDVLGRTRATLKESACFTLPVRKDRVTAEPPSWLGLGTAMIPMNQESLVGAGH